MSEAQRRSSIVLYAAALMLGVACTSETQATDPVARGAQLYRDLNCGACHESHFGLPAEAPPLDHIGRVAAQRRPGQDAATYLRATALKMPGGRAQRLPPNDLEALVQYLVSLQ